MQLLRELLSLRHYRANISWPPRPPNTPQWHPGSLSFDLDDLDDGLTLVNCRWPNRACSWSSHVGCRSDKSAYPTATVLPLTAIHFCIPSLGHPNMTHGEQARWWILCHLFACVRWIVSNPWSSRYGMLVTTKNIIMTDSYLMNSLVNRFGRISWNIKCLSCLISMLNNKCHLWSSPPSVDLESSTNAVPSYTISRIV